MNQYLNLCDLFPDDESRYSAFIKMLIIGMIMFVLKAVSDILFDGLVIVDLLIVLFWVACIYIGLYIFVKAGVLKFILKILMNLCVSAFIYSILITINPGLAAFLSLGFLLFSASRKKRRDFVMKNKRYIGYVLAPYAVGIFFYILFIVLIFMSTLRPHDTTIMESIAAICLLIALFAPTWIFIRIAKKEQARGIPFLEMCRMLSVVPFSAILLFISCISLVSSHLFNGEAFLDELDLNFFPDSTMSAAVPDAIHSFESSASPLDHLSADTSPDVSSAFSTDVPMAATTDLSTFTYAGFPSIFDSVPGIPDNQFCFDPNVLANASITNQPVTLLDPSGMQAMKLDNGIILGPDNSHIGEYEFNKAFDRNVFYDNDKNILFTVDSNGGYFDKDGVSIGKLDKLGAADVFMDNQQNIAYKTINGTIFNGNGEIVGSVKV